MNLTSGKTSRTWRIRTVTAQQLDVASEKLNCHPSELVDVLIAHGLANLQSGQLSIRRRAIISHHAVEISSED